MSAVAEAACTKDLLAHTWVLSKQIQPMEGGTFSRTDLPWVDLSRYSTGFLFAFLAPIVKVMAPVAVSASARSSKSSNVHHVGNCEILQPETTTNFTSIRWTSCPLGRCESFHVNL